MSTVKNGQKQTIPSSMESKLRAIQKRLVRRTLVRAGASGLSVLLVLMIVCMIVDWSLMLFDPAVRLSLTAGTLLAAALACLWVGYRPLKAALGWTDAARRVDDETPLLEERWTTVMTFSESEVHPVNSTARAMLQHVTTEAVVLGELVKPQEISRTVSPRKALLTLAGCLVLCAGFLATNWPQTSILLLRFWNPLADITATQLASTSGDLTIPLGESVDLSASVSGLTRDEAQLTVKYDSGLQENFPLEADPEAPRQFRHSLRVNESFQYQMAAGDGRTAWNRVTAIDYPMLKEISFKVIPPAYLDREIYEKSWIPSRVKVAEGSMLNLVMQPDIPLERFDVKLTHQPEEGEPVEEILALQPRRDGSFLFELPLLENLTIEPLLRSTYGLANENRHVCRIEVIPDMAPIARVITPNDETAVADDDVVKIEFEAHDDHGIKSAELVIYDESTREEGKEPEILEVRNIDLKEQTDQKHVLAQTELDLKELNLKPGRQISLAVRVKDNRELSSMEREHITSLARDLEASRIPPSETESETRTPRMSTETADTNRTADQQQQMIASAEQKTQNDPEGRISEDQPLVAKNDDAENPNRDPEQEGSPSGKPDENKSPNATASNEHKSADDAEAKSQSKNSDSPKAEDNVAASPKENQQPADPAKGVAKSNEKSEDPQPGDQVAGKNENEKKPGDSEPAEDQPGSVAKSSDDNSEKTNKDDTGKNTPGENVAATEGENQKPDAKDGPAGQENPEGPADPQDSNQDNPAVASAEQKANADDSGKEPKPGSNSSQMPQEAQQNNSSVASSSSRQSSKSADPKQPQTPRESNIETVPLDKLISLSPQESDDGQNVESNRRKLKITQRLASVTDKVKEPAPKSNVRDRIVALDEQLAVVESGLQKVLKREIPDADRELQFQRLDKELLTVEETIADIRNDTKDGQFAFVGLQMTEIGRFHITPARDHVFAAMQSPVGSDSNTSKSLHHVERAREQLAALLKRYDDVVQEKKLEKSLDETVKIYEVYVDKRHKLMREARQNKHPLDRKMAVIEVNQEYLDRYAEVLTLRREMLAELARMLADDPRLASRYLDLIKRRRASLLEQLSELSERQEDLTTEVSGWLAVDESQRKDLWTIIVDLRLQSADQMASDAAEFSEQMMKQLPLSLDAERGTAAAALRFVQDAAQAAREISFETRNMYGGAEETSLQKVAQNTSLLLTRLRQTERALDRLSFENDGIQADGQVDEVVEYASARLAELQVVSDRANDWSRTLQNILKQQYPLIASRDQQRVGIATELLRVSLLSMEGDLETQFQRAALGDPNADPSLPREVKELVYELQRVMEGITLNQTAAVYSLSVCDLPDAELQQVKALEGFHDAEDLFEKIRRTVVRYLDEFEVADPNIAQLEDPTLDRFLEELEREPNIQTQLGIPNRPSNLRVIADTMRWQLEGGVMLGDSLKAASQRMRDTLKKKRKDEEEQMAGNLPEDAEQQKPDPETDVKDLEEMIRLSVAKLEEKMQKPETTEAERRKLEAMAENMRRFLKVSHDQPNAQQLWRRMVESDEAEAMLKAMARGEALPDQQWNKILSSLNEGLWQIRGRTPPEEFRKSIEQYQDQVRKLIDAGAALPEPAPQASPDQNSR